MLLQSSPFIVSFCHSKFTGWLPRWWKKGPHCQPAVSYFTYTRMKILIYFAVFELHWRNMFSASRKRGKSGIEQGKQMSAPSWNVKLMTHDLVSLRFLKSQANDKWLDVEKWDVLIFLIYDLDACYHLLQFRKAVTSGMYQPQIFVFSVVIDCNPLYLSDSIYFYINWRACDVNFCHYAPKCNFWLENSHWTFPQMACTVSAARSNQSPEWTRGKRSIPKRFISLR